MTAPRSTVCEPWATAADVYAAGEKYAGLDAYTLADWLEVSSSLLWRKTGKRYPGVCTDLVRPCGRSYGSRNAPVWHGAAGDLGDGGGDWRWFSSWGYCGCDRPLGRGCSCSGPSQITLGRTPIVEILEVTIDGDVLDPGEYRVDDFRWLVRLPDSDGTRHSWPCCQRLDLPLTDEDTFGILFSYGRTPPPEGVLAAAIVAGEFALDASGLPCNLPAELTRASRQNLDFAIVTPSSDVWEQMPLPVRMAVETMNPHGLDRSPKVWTPDLDPSPPTVRPDTASSS